AAHAHAAGAKGSDPFPPHLPQLCPCHATTPPCRLMARLSGRPGAATRWCGFDVYFAADGAPFRTAAVKVPVYQKDPGDDVPVCCGFGWTRRRIRDELAQTGKSTASATIAAHVKAGRCGCEVNNPQGACCLGNVQAVVRQWKATLP